MRSLPKIKTLESDRLILRKITLGDAQELFDYAKNPDITKYVFWDAHKTIKESKEFIQQTLKEYKKYNRLMWAVELKEQKGIIGTCGFMLYYPTSKTLEVGYAFNPKFGHHGYAREALNTIIDYSFTNMDIVRIEGICVVENLASAKVMESCHMQFEGIMHDSFVKHDQPYNCKMFAITKRNWEKLNNKNQNG